MVTPDAIRAFLTCLGGGGVGVEVVDVGVVSVGAVPVVLVVVEGGGVSASA